MLALILGFIPNLSAKLLVFFVTTKYATTNYALKLSAKNQYNLN